MSQSQAIREAIAASLAGIRTVTGIDVSPVVLSSPVPPCGYVADGEIHYDKAGSRGLDELFFTVVLLAGFTTDTRAQQRLDDLRAPSGALSVKTLIEADRTLGSVCDDLQVTKATAPDAYKLPTSSNLGVGAEWTVRVLATP